MEIRWACSAEQSEIRQLWDRCFPDSDGFNDHFFARIFDCSMVLLMRNKKKIVSMLQMMPFLLQYKQTSFPLTYIYGACTHPEERGRGYMAKLLQASFSIDQKTGKAGSFLIPATKDLFNFYKKFGYNPFFYNQTVLYYNSQEAHPGFAVASMAAADLPEMRGLYEACFQNTGFLFRDPIFWQQQLDLFQNVGYAAEVLYKNEKKAGYAFLWNTETGILAQEMLCRSKEDYTAFAQLLMQKYRIEKLRGTIAAKTNWRQPIGCLKLYQPLPMERCYLNLMFN